MGHALELRILAELKLPGGYVCVGVCDLVEQWNNGAGEARTLR